jgi:1-deoxy-D-xylulose-5-phosphate reductoisomerase
MNSVFDMSNDMSVQRSITVLGATGSIGASTLDLVRRNPGAFRVEALTAHAQVAELAALAREFRAPGRRGRSGAPGRLRAALAGSGVEAAAGPDALVEAAARGADITVAAIVGCAGLAPTMAAIECGKIVALANKEALVSAGEVMTAAVARSGATLLPVDSSTTPSSSAWPATRPSMCG